MDEIGTRILLGDYSGTLHVLLLRMENGIVASLHVEPQGDVILTKIIIQVSIPSSLSYIDEGYVFVGSHYGDSQLIKLLTEHHQSGELIETVDSINNLAPLIDFCVVDLENQGQA